MRTRSMSLLFPCLVFSLLVPQWGYSQEEIAKYPSRPINFIMSVPPGAGVDLACRLLIKEAEKSLGQSIIAINKPGGAFTLGNAAIASSKPDGYTIGWIAGNALFLVSQIERVPFHALKDFRWIMQFGYMNFGITVKGDSPFKTLNDVIVYARQNPGKLVNGCGGIGGFGHVLMEQVARKEEVKVTHMPFKGGPDTEKALLGRHIHIMTGDVNYSLLEAGETRLLALLADHRSPDFPQTSTLRDLGYDIPAPTILPIAAPKGLPEEIAKKLEEVFTRAMKEPGFVKGMRTIRFPIAHRNSKELEEYVTQNYVAFTKILTEMGLIK